MGHVSQVTPHLEVISHPFGKTWFELIELCSAFVTAGRVWICNSQIRTISHINQQRWLAGLHNNCSFITPSYLFLKFWPFKSLLSKLLDVGDTPERYVRQTKLRNRRHQTSTLLHKPPCVLADLYRIAKFANWNRCSSFSCYILAV